MKNTLQKAKTQKNKKTIFFVLRALLFAYLMALPFGCDESSQTSPDGFGDFNFSDRYQSRADTTGPLSEAYQIIWSGLANINPLVRVNAIEVVATTRQGRLMPTIERLLGDEFAPVRFAAALAVGDLRYSLATRSVSQLLKDENDSVIIAAAYAMTRFGFREYSEVLRAAIDSEDQTVRANAAFLLGKSGDKSALKLLDLAVQRKDSDDKVIFVAAEAMARLGDEQIYPKLWTMLISAYADVRVTGIRAMGALGTPEAKDALITILDDSVLEVRLVAAEQLGVLKDTTGEREVLDVFEKNLTAGMDKVARERVNKLTALAIGQIGTPPVVKFLPQLLKNESEFVRIAAAKAVFQTTVK
jgi:HEAT repeat protein